MNKTIGVLVIVVIGLGIVNGFLLYQLNTIQELNNDLERQHAELEDKNTELENRISQVTNKVNIISFSIWGFKPVEEFVVWRSNVIVRIQNLGINELEGLTLKIVGFGDDSLAESLDIDELQVGETKEISTYSYWAYGSAGTSVATIFLGDLVLDEYLLEFSEVYPPKY
jgi:hypothetical protein